MRRVLLPVVAVASLAACSKPTPPAEPPPAPAAAAQAAAAAPAPAAPGITEEKLKGYLVYQKEMLPHTREAAEIAMGAYRQAGGDAKAMEAKMAQDERLQKFNALNEAALKKAGITMADVSTVMPAVTPYFTARMMAADAKKQLEEVAKRKAAGKPGIADEAVAGVHQETVAKADEARKSAEARWGQETVALFDKYEAEYLDYLHQQMEMMLKPAGRK